MTRRTTDDPELQAMAALVTAMDPLDGDQRDRVREWFVARYGDTSGLALGRKPWHRPVEVDGKVPDPAVLTP